MQTKEEFERWYNFLLPICSQKLNRLKSDVFNRVAKQLDGDSDEGSAGEPVKAPAAVVEEEQDMYELVRKYILVLSLTLIIKIAMIYVIPGPP